MVEELGGAGKKEALCHCAVSCDNGRRVVTLTTKKSTNSTYINFWGKGALSVVTKPITYVDKTLEKLNCLEISTDKSLLFGAGENALGGCLVAFSNDKYFDYVCKEEFADEPVAAVKKLSNSDILIVGAKTRLSIMHYEGGHFSMLRNFSNIFSEGRIISLDYFGKEIVALNENGN